jgi:Uma2 family endonuclease
MAIIEQTIEQQLEVYEPDISHLITEDDTPLDNLFSEHQQRLLADGLHKNWQAPNNQPFVALANVGLYYGVHTPAIVPDFMLSVGVEYPENYWDRRHRCYFVWEFGKSPDIAVEIISNLVGKEMDSKFDKYALASVPYYIIFDPSEQYGADTLRVFVRNGSAYHRLEKPYFETLGLGCTLWTGEYDGMYGTWLRWTNAEGLMIPTGTEATIAAEERADEAESRADEAESRADDAESRADDAESRLRKEQARLREEQARAQEERNRAERLAAKLKELGINPDALV